jgi:crotonobetainyl-CoA:carnitine CoA-transferase CaiB-like acyl-CoA transferase
MAPSPHKQPRPLEGVTVLDFTTALAGPYATLLLAGLGARVIKVENPRAPDTARANAPYLGADGVKLVRERDDDVSLAIIERARNKEAVTLDLKMPGAAAVFADLVRKADVLVENFSAGTADRIGIGYAATSAINPRLVYTSISGFGADATGTQNKAMDTIVQAMSGMMMTSGEAGAPPVRVGVPFGDLSAPLFAVIGTLAALRQAQATGRGQHVDVSLLGALTSLVACEPFELLQRSGHETRTGNVLPRLGAFGVFATADGHVAICAPTDTFVGGMFRAMARPELAGDPRFATRDARVAHSGALHDLMRAWTGGLASETVLALLAEQGVPAGPVRTPHEAVSDPRLRARGEIQAACHPIYGTHDEALIGGLPIVMSDSTVGFDRPAPMVGEHNHAIYHDLLGYPAAEVDRLKRDRVI